MTTSQIQALINRHEPARKKAGLSWIGYLHMLISRGVGFFEIVDIAGYLGVGGDDYNNLLITLYTRAHNHTALNRLHNRLLAQSA